MKTVLTIAGSDCSGGAGIQGDLKTMTSHRVYGMSVITALTAQNTTGVYGVIEVPSEFVADQLDCVLRDIKPDAVKIGMVSNSKIIRVIYDKLKEYGAINIVVDPVMVSTSGSRLLCDDALSAMKGLLFPTARIITPNIPEAESLSGVRIQNKDDMVRAAMIISRITMGDVLVKGGHLESCADDLLYTDDKAHWYESDRIDNSNTHGTGCTLSSAIACNLALGLSMDESVRRSKSYITGALLDGLDLGRGSGPLNHSYWL